jgi:hypothetical protein
MPLCILAASHFSSQLARCFSQHDRKEAALVEWAESLRSREDDLVRRELGLEAKERELDDLTLKCAPGLFVVAPVVAVLAGSTHCCCFATEPERI